MIHVFINGRLAKKQDVILSSESLLNTLCPNCNATVDVNIEILTKVDENLAGYCWGDSEHIEIELARKSNDYTYTREEFLLNLTHELVHAKQLINKQFEFKLQEELIKNLPYNKLPWEEEAYGLENSLFEEFFKRLT
tara:strand:- start:755 stop:1165 length:411 start_codon:yes stop_codon:yes gene_type:complete